MPFAPAEPVTDGEECERALVSLGVPVVGVSKWSGNLCYKDGQGNGYNNGHQGGGAYIVCSNNGW